MREEREQDSPATKGFRTRMDIGMGLVYFLVGSLLVYSNYFGQVKLSPALAYSLGMLTVLYGCFRIYRGIKGLSR